MIIDAQGRIPHGVKHSMEGDSASEPPGTRLTRTFVPEPSMHFYVSCVDIFIIYEITFIDSCDYDM